MHDEPALLHQKSSVQIGDRPCIFLLPLDIERHTPKEFGFPTAVGNNRRSEIQQLRGADHDEEDEDNSDEDAGDVAARRQTRKRRRVDAVGFDPEQAADALRKAGGDRRPVSFASVLAEARRAHADVAAVDPRGFRARLFECLVVNDGFEFDGSDNSKSAGWKFTQ